MNIARVQVAVFTNLALECFWNECLLNQVGRIVQVTLPPARSFAHRQQTSLEVMSKLWEEWS